MTLLESKERRARLILEAFRALEEKNGSTMVMGAPNASETPRAVRFDDNMRAIFTPNQRIGIGRLTQEKAGERYFDDDGWCLVVVEVRNKRRMVVNVRGDVVQVHLHEHGLWEQWLGLEAEDMPPYHNLPYPDPESPAWQAVMASDDYKRPPLRITVLPNAQPNRRRGRQLRFQ